MFCVRSLPVSQLHHADKPERKKIRFCCCFFFFNEANLFLMFFDQNYKASMIYKVNQYEYTFL